VSSELETCNFHSSLLASLRREGWARCVTRQESLASEQRGPALVSQSRLDFPSLSHSAFVEQAVGFVSALRDTAQPRFPFTASFLLSSSQTRPVLGTLAARRACFKAQGLPIQLGPLFREAPTTLKMGRDVHRQYGLAAGLHIAWMPEAAVGMVKSTPRRWNLSPDLPWTSIRIPARLLDPRSLGAYVKAQQHQTRRH
jgi:hypothetical protein